MTRHAYPAALRGLPACWVLHLLSRFKCSIEQLNQNLTLPLDSPTKPFMFGVNPRCQAPQWAPPLFERALELGKFPDEGVCNDPVISGAKFNLFARVTEYAPNSEDWLFRRFRFYFWTRPPDMRLITSQIDLTLYRFGIERLKDQAAISEMRCDPETLEALEQECLDEFVEYCEPVHIELVFGLFHEAQWAAPMSDRARMLERRCTELIDAFMSRTEFTWNDAAKEHQTKVRVALEEVLWRISSEAFRTSCKQEVPQQFLLRHIQNYRWHWGRYSQDYLNLPPSTNPIPHRSPRFKATGIPELRASFAL